MIMVEIDNVTDTNSFVIRLHNVVYEQFSVVMLESIQSIIH